MALRDYIGWNEGEPDWYLNANYGHVVDSDRLFYNCNHHIYGARRNFVRRGSEIIAQITIRLELGYGISRRDYNYESTITHMLRDAAVSEASLYREALEKYGKDYPNDRQRYSIKEIIMEDQDTGDTFTFRL